MKRIFLVFLLIIFISANSTSVAWPSEAKRLVDNLYMSAGHLPIIDLIVEFEVAYPLEEGKDDTALKFVEKTHLVFKKPTKFRITRVINLPGEPTDQRILICDGTSWWQYVPSGQYPISGPLRVQPSPMLNLPPNIQVFPEDANNIYTLVGRETINNVPTKVVKIQDKNDGVVTRIWIDTSRWVPMKLEKKIPDPGGGEEDIVKVCKYSKFKKLKDGRWFPFVIEIYENGKINRMLVYKRVSVNKGVEDNLFEPMKKFVK